MFLRLNPHRRALPIAHSQFHIASQGGLSPTLFPANQCAVHNARCAMRAARIQALRHNLFPPRLPCRIIYSKTVSLFHIC
jgi:hypothetical protein